MLDMLKKSSLFIGAALVVVVFLIFMKDDVADENNVALNAVPAPINNTDQNLMEEDEQVAIVDVKGAVLKPGIYELDIGSRVNDVIHKAGGFTKNADQTQVNLAQKIQDEMVIFIPKEGEVTQAIERDTNGSDKIRINDATEEEIETLNGIGPSKAQAIIQYRDENGPFQTAEDLLEVSGIGEKTLENLKDDIQVP